MINGRKFFIGWAQLCTKNMTVESHAFNVPPELGTRQHYIDNVTMFSGHTVVGYCIMALLVVTTPFRHRDLNIFCISSSHWSSTVSRCRCREAKIVVCPALALFSYTLGQVGAGGWPQRRGTDSGTGHTIPKIIWNFRKKTEPGTFGADANATVYF